ncbi:MAG: Flp family type IVb pilin [Perlabentimonas sp.]
MRLFREDDGVTSIEYALIAVLIAIAIVVTLDQVGVTVSGFYQSVADAFP